MIVTQREFAKRLAAEIDKFGQVADPRLNDIVASDHSRNAAFVGRYFDDLEFQSVVKDEARRRAYNLIVSPARTEALRKLRDQVSTGSGHHGTASTGR